MSGARISWPEVLEVAAEIVRGYDIGVTLRQLHYRLVSIGAIPNTKSAYTVLSSRTAAARREGRFPALVDNTRSIDRALSWSSPYAALRQAVRWYRRDRREGQEFNLYLGVEKHALRGLLDAWFGHLGAGIIALGGYASEPLESDVQNEIWEDGRPAVLIYAGDFDPSGEDILRAFVANVDAFDEVRRIALTAEQVEEYDLPPQLGKAQDSRAAAFIERHGRLVQVELDALEPDDLRELYKSTIEEYWDDETYEVVLAREAEERAEFAKLLDLVDQ